MAYCLIGLGSNLGDRNAALSCAVSHIKNTDRMHLIATSKWRETKAVGGPIGQMDFLNGAILVETDLRPETVLDLLLRIEADMGRVRKTDWGPRVIDLDLLLYDEEIVESDRLTLPHPRMAWRRFVLEPAAEIAGDLVHPSTGWTAAKLLHHLDSAHNYVAVAGSIGAGKTQLACRVAESAPARMVAEELDAGGLTRFYDDPAGTAWQMELEFLQQRTRLLAANSEEWSQRREPTISDFWFDQSAAFATVWLREYDLDRFLQRWETARASVVQPKLTVVLCEPKYGHENAGATSLGGWLSTQVRQRGRAYETRLSGELLHNIEQAVLRQADKADLGPVLRLSAAEPQRAVEEVVAAIKAMQ